MNLGSVFIPIWLIITVLAAIVLTVIVIILVSRLRHRKFIKELVKSTAEEYSITSQYADSFFLSKSKVIENFARKNNPKVIRFTGIADLWLKRFKSRHNERDMNRLIEFAPEMSLFTLFLVSLTRKSYQKPVFKAIKNLGVIVLARSCTGQAFPAKESLELLKDYDTEIRELAGDPEWKARYFAISLLIFQEDQRAKRALTEAFDDPHPLVRSTVVSQMTTESRNQIYELVRSRLLNDAAYEVREAASKRINAEFTDLHKIKYQELSISQVVHAVDFLSDKLDDDMNLALDLLREDNLELRFPAAIFLQNAGYLNRLIAEVRFSDSELLERNSHLLSQAAEVHVTDFLKSNFSDACSVFVALEILAAHGDRRLIAGLAEKAFNLATPETPQVWEKGVQAIVKRRSSEALKVLLKELDKQRYHKEKASYILEHLPVSEDSQITDQLYKLLLDENFQERQALRVGFAKLSLTTVLPRLKLILRGGRKSYAHKIRINALQILADYKLPYFLQVVLEQLPTLPLEEAREFTQILVNYGGSEFSKRVTELLALSDGKIRASIISSLPVDQKKAFKSEINDAMNDADPDVRIAAVWALIEMGESKIVNKSLDMLRDPIRRVRVSASRAIGTYGSDAVLKEMVTILADENEVDIVKEAVCEGLGASQTRTSVALLVEALDTFPALQKPLLRALQDKTSKAGLQALIEELKDAQPVLREKLVEVFSRMGETAEPAIRELLEEDIQSLKPYIAETLDNTGFIEAQMRKLSHRDPRIRRDSAYFLSLVGSESAYRGVVLAARDPDEEVRVMVTKAVERLNQDSGQNILDALKNDPDRRVRKYTLWALERLKAKKIED
jgi:HEAT repeat protein